MCGNPSLLRAARGPTPERLGDVLANFESGRAPRGARDRAAAASARLGFLYYVSIRTGAERSCVRGDFNRYSLAVGEAEAGLYEVKATDGPDDGNQRVERRDLGRRARRRARPEQRDGPSRFFRRSRRDVEVVDGFAGLGGPRAVD